MQTIRYRTANGCDIFPRANPYRGIDLAQPLPTHLYLFLFESFVHRRLTTTAVSATTTTLDDEEERACCDGAFEKKKRTKDTSRVPV